MTRFPANRKTIMTEVVQTDSTEEEGATESTIDDGVIDLGADLEGDIEAPTIDPIEESDSSPEARAPATDATKDALRTPSTQEEVESLPEQMRPMARRLLADHTQKTQAAAQLTRDVASLSQQNRLQALAQQQGARGDAVNGDAEADPFAAVRARLAPEEQGALDIMREVVRADVGQTLTTQGQQVEQLTNAVRQLAVHIVGQATNSRNSEATAAREQYPDIDQYQPQINALTPVTNPATQKNYTVTEAYELLTGISGQKSASLRATEGNVRRTAATKTSSIPSVAADSDSGALSEAALAQKLAALGLKA